MKKTVLLIDDDQEFLEELENLLVSHGYDTVALNDVQSAVEVSLQRKPDVILMDFKMPGKSGFELADEMSRIENIRNIPIIGISGFFKDEFNAFMHFCGIKVCLKKPFQIQDIVAAIESATAHEHSPIPTPNK